MGNPARGQEQRLAIGFHKQTGTGLKTTTPAQLHASLGSADMWGLESSAFISVLPDLKNEDDADFYGKGHEFATQLFPTSIDAQIEWPFHLTSQNFAQAIAFAFGKVTESNPATGAYRYIATLMDPANDGVNLPAVTIMGSIRKGLSEQMLNMALIGCVCTGFTLRLQKGPGLANSSLIMRWSCCGAYDDDTAVAMPTIYTQTRLGSGTASPITLNGVDYFARANFLDMEFTYDNAVNPDSGYIIGGGSQDSFDIRGRQRYGKRKFTLACRVEMDKDSTEFADLRAGVEGETRIKLTGPLISAATYHAAEIILPRTRHRAVKMEEQDDFAAANLDTRIMWDDSAGPAMAIATTDKTGIGASA